MTPSPAQTLPSPPSYEHDTRRRNPRQWVTCSRTAGSYARWAQLHVAWYSRGAAGRSRHLLLQHVLWTSDRLVRMPKDRAVARGGSVANTARRVSTMTLPASLMGFGLFRMVSEHIRLPFTPVENVLVQTVAGSMAIMPLGCGFVGVVWLSHSPAFPDPGPPWPCIDILMPNAATRHELSPSPRRDGSHQSQHHEAHPMGLRPMLLWRCFRRSTVSPSSANTSATFSRFVLSTLALTRFSPIYIRGARPMLPLLTL